MLSGSVANGTASGVGPRPAHNRETHALSVIRLSTVEDRAAGWPAPVATMGEVIEVLDHCLAGRESAECIGLLRRILSRRSDVTAHSGPGHRITTAAHVERFRPAWSDERAAA